MKKRIVSAILMLCMLLSMVPTAILPASAEAVQNGAGGATNAATGYADLYVGVNGEATVNGGTLTVFLAAYKGLSSLSLSEGIWKNTAKGATEDAVLGGTWTAYEKGGVGYDLAKFDNSYMLSLDASLLPTDTYTLEIVASVRGVTENADGVTSFNKFGTTANMSLGRFRTFLFCGPIGTSDPYHTRYGNSLVTMYTESPATNADDYYTVGAESGHWNTRLDLYRENPKTQSLSITLSATETKYEYYFRQNGADITPHTHGCAKGSEVYVGSFIINRAMPATYYAVRLYTKPLTEAELAQNRAIDILLHANIPFSVYESVHEDDRKSFLSLVAEKDFTVTAADIDGIVADLAAIRAVEKEAAKKTAYDALYVGADGSKTENGGSLSILLSAYETASVIFHEKSTVWYDKMGNHNATLAGSLWQKYEGGGVGYDLGAFDYSQYLSIDPTALPTDTYTLEIISSVRGITRNADGVTPYNVYGQTASISLGRFRGFLFCGPLGTSDPYHTRYGNAIVTMFTEAQTTTTDDYSTTGSASGNWNTRLDAYREDTSIVALSVTLTESDTKYTYGFTKNGLSANPTARTCAKGDAAYIGSFILNRSMPATLYAVRLYTKPLTEAELAENHFVDLLAYTKTDPTEYLNWDAETRAFVVDALSETGILDKAAFDEALKNALDLVVSEWDAETSLYVTDGLTVLLASYDGFSTATRFSDSSVLWTNAVKDATFGTLVGSGWYRSEDGGIRIRETVSALVAANQNVTSNRHSEFYLTFDYEYLPDGDYTIESVLAPEGITVEAEDGTITPYYDDYTRYGIYTDRMFVLGAYRAIGWVCDTHSEGATDLQHRWLYQTDGCWNDRTDATRVKVGRDYSLGNLNLSKGQIGVYSVVHDIFEEPDNDNIIATYTTYLDGKKGLLSEIPVDMYMTNDEVADKAFDMWRGMAATHYAIRVYDRILTEEEKLQNRVADVCYYLGLDTSMLEDTLSKIPDKATVFKAFAHLSFDMTKEEAQRELDNGMAGIWVGYDGVAVKGDMSDTLRFYFTLSYSSITAIINAGFALELGTIVNLTGDMPNLAESAYDYRFVAFDSVSGAHRQYFLDEDTYAVTLSYVDGDIDLYNQNIKVVSYVRLTAKNGEEMIFYGGLTGKAYGSITSLFTVMHHFDAENLIEDSALASYVSGMVSDNYYDHTVYFDSHAEGEGNGSKESPYTDFTDAFLACKEALLALDRPTNVRLFVEGGTHALSEILELDFDVVTYPYYYYTIEGNYLADEAPELTTTVSLSSSDFEAVAGKAGLYVYEFAPDAEGKYPEFRNLYVDGLTATRAHTTPVTTSKGERPLEFAYDRDLPGGYLLAQFYYQQGTLLENTPEKVYAALPERTDLIASYTKHYEWFLALADLRAAYNANEKAVFATLTADDLRDGMGEEYAAAVAFFKEDFIKAYNGGVKVANITYAAPTFTKATRTGLFYVHMETVEGLRPLVEERLADLKANKAYWLSEVTRREALLAEKEAAYAAAKADYEEKLAAAGKPGATDEEKVAYIAAKAVMEAAEAPVAEAETYLADAKWRVYNESSYKIATRTLGIELHVAGNWCFNIMDIDGIDFEDVIYHYDERHDEVETLVAVYLNESQYQHYQIPDGYTTADRLYSVQNALCFVDEEGEYYYDEAAGKLYYFTEYDIEALSFARPTMDNIFVFKDTKNFVLSDLTFWGVDNFELSKYGIASNQGAGNKILQARDYEISFTKKSVFTSWNTKNTTIRDCYFHDLASAAIYMEGRTENVTISGNEFEEIGAHTINIAPVPGVPGGSSEFSERSGAEGILITENYLHEVSTESYAAPAITMPSTKDAELSYNTIIGCAYTGISIGWYYSPGTWEEHERYNLYNVNIHHNYITDFMQELGDGGAIYVLGGNLKPDNPKQVNFCHHNFVVMSKYTGNGMNELTNGYYYDGASSNWSNYNNICVNYSAGADRGKLAGASDEDYHQYMSMKGSNLMFKQNHPQAISYNIHSWNNYFYNVRAKTAAEQQSEVYHLHPQWKQHGHTISDCSYFTGDNKLSFSNSIKALIEECGSRMRPGEWEWLIGNDY